MRANFYDRMVIARFFAIAQRMFASECCARDCLPLNTSASYGDKEVHDCKKVRLV